MGLIKFLDKKTTFDSQRGYLKSFLFFGAPFGYIIGQVLLLVMSGWSKYHLTMGSVIYQIVFCLIFASPLIYNYFKQTNKIRLLKKKHLNKTLVYKVKCIIDYKWFVKGQLYEIEVVESLTSTKEHRVYDCLVIGKNNFDMYDLSDIINKFELVDNLKEERKKKLEKLQKAIK